MIQPIPRPGYGRLIEIVEAMFSHDKRGRLVGDAPHFYVLRISEQAISRCHADLDDKTAESLDALAHRPRGRPREWQDDYAFYSNVLTHSAPLRSIRAGPIYGFNKPIEVNGSAVKIDKQNIEILNSGFDEWRPDAVAGNLMAAIVENGQAVSICASVRASASVHCAGVETLPTYRGKGFAARAVEAWASAVMRIGATPVYATTFDNLSSQGVARRLDLDLIGSEFSIICDMGGR